MKSARCFLMFKKKEKALHLHVIERCDKLVHFSDTSKSLKMHQGPFSAAEGIFSLPHKALHVIVADTEEQGKNTP